MSLLPSLSRDSAPHLRLPQQQGSAAATAAQGALGGPDDLCYTV